MMREWPEQKLAETLREALDMSIAKWDFLSTCSVFEFEDNLSHISEWCGLCHYHHNESFVKVQRCMMCKFHYLGNRDCCPDQYLEAYRQMGKMIGGFVDSDLLEFHRLSRVVLEMLEALI